jgi:hypothetical protein
LTELVFFLFEVVDDETKKFDAVFGVVTLEVIVDNNRKGANVHKKQNNNKRKVLGK